MVKKYINENKELMKEWDWEANDKAGLDPNKLTLGSNKKANWKCKKCSGTWQAAISDRTRRKSTACPYCASQKVLAGYNDLATKYPKIISQWNQNKNKQLKPTDVMPGSSKKVWWICPKGHEYEQAISARVLHPNSCPVCSGQKVVPGVNDLQFCYPKIASEWHPTKNGTVTPSQVAKGSNKKFWWKCHNCGHEWQVRVADRTRDNTGCPVCANKVLAKGVNDLETKFPEIAKEWHPIKNGNLKPSDVLAGNHKKVWWICKLGHEYEQAIYQKTAMNQGCPICARQKIWKGYNDLETKYPDIAKEWHPTKNGDLKPSQVMPGSHKKVWWICSKNHAYKQAINKRTSRGDSCPYCSGESALSGYNDFATKYPAIAKEWHPTKNGDLKPSDFTYGSGKKVWWKCPIGHEYQAVIRDRGIGQTNCPICNLRNETSFPEQAVYFYLKKLYPDALSKYRIKEKSTMELDVYIPSIKFAVEYDGASWHKTEEEHERERKKYKFCKEQGITLIRVKEKNGNIWNDVCDYVYYIKPVKRSNLHELEKIIHYILNSICSSIDEWLEQFKINRDILMKPQEKHLTYETKPLKFFRHNIDVNLERDKANILNYVSKIEKSLDDLRPDVANKWNYEKNGNLKPNMFSVGSSEIVWWKCQDCGHEWKSSIASMTRKGRYGCAICSLTRRSKTFTKGVVKKRGSLAENMPDLAREWHPTKNGTLTPNDITTGRFKPVWWLCPECGYEWQAPPNNRKKGIGCPCCSGRVPKPGVNDLETKYPDVAKEWNYEKNAPLTPKDVLPGSGRKVWWKCHDCGYTWKTIVRTRVKGSKCPNCHGLPQLPLKY